MFEFKFRIVAKHGGVVVATERTNSLRVVNDSVIALAAEGNEVWIYEQGKPPFQFSSQPVGISEIDSLMDDFFAFSAAVKR